MRLITHIPIYLIKSKVSVAFQIEREHCNSTLYEQILDWSKSNSLKHKASIKERLIDEKLHTADENEPPRNPQADNGPKALCISIRLYLMEQT